MYSNIFSTYEATDSPPIITKGYKDTKSFFDSLTKPDKQKVKQEQNLWSSVTFPKPTINYIFYSIPIPIALLLIDFHEHIKHVGQNMTTAHARVKNNIALV